MTDRTIPYTAKLALLLAVTLTVGFAVLAFQIGRADELHDREVLRRRTRSIANSAVAVARAAHGATFASTEIRQALCVSLAEIESVLAVEIFDESGTVVAHSKPERVGKRPEPAHATFVRRILGGDGPIEEWDEEKQQFAHFLPIEMDGVPSHERVAVLELVMDTSHLAAHVSEDRKQRALLFLVTGGIAVLILSVGTRRVVAVERARDEANARAQQLGEIVEESLNEIFVFDAETLLFQSANHGARDNLGYSSEELAQMTPVDIKPEFTRASFEAAIAPLLSGETDDLRFETVHRRKDGSTYPVEVFLVLSRRGPKPVFVAIILDITERRRAEAELRQAQKMEALGQLAAGVAHDFNSLLTVMLCSVDLARQAGVAEVETDLQQIENACTRATALTRQLLAFGRRQAVSPVPLDPGRVAEELLPLLRRLIREDVNLSVRRTNDGTCVNMDPGQLEQVLTNLVVNARDALEGTGTIGITIGHGTWNGHEGKAERCVQLSVEDTGSGIPAADLDRVLEPFFTTKPLGRGTGLGLSTAHGIVRQAGGTIEIESTVGEGTTFHVRLPVCDEPAAHPRPVALPDTASRGNETLLVCEDDPHVLGVLIKVLGSSGYNVLSAAHPHVALGLLADHQETVSLLITDVVMPGMNGYELADEVVRRRPGMRVLFVSGYAPSAVRKSGTHWPDSDCLEKPFAIQELLERTREILTRPTTA